MHPLEWSSGALSPHRPRRTTWRVQSGHLRQMRRPLLTEDVGVRHAVPHAMMIHLSILIHLHLLGHDAYCSLVGLRGSRGNSTNLRQKSQRVLDTSKSAVGPSARCPRTADRHCTSTGPVPMLGLCPALTADASTATTSSAPPAVLTSSTSSAYLAQAHLAGSAGH